MFIKSISMYSITFKGVIKKDSDLVKIDMIFYKTGYARVPKAISITGLYKDWDQKKQSFKPNTEDAIEKNNNLNDLRLKYLKVAESWEREEKEWTPRELSHSLEKTKKKPIRNITVSKMVDELIEICNKRTRFKNGKLISCQETGKNYGYCRNTLRDFTREKKKRDFDTYYIHEINEAFLTEYVQFLQLRAAKKGKSGSGVGTRLRKIYGIFKYAETELGYSNLDYSVFKPFSHLTKRKKKYEPKTIPFEVLKAMENIDRNLLTRYEEVRLDMFLFCFYSGGMAEIDMAYLTWDCVIDGKLIHERHKFPKTAKMPLFNRAIDIANKYRDKCIGNYVLPIFTQKHDTEKKQRCAIKTFRNYANPTLKKIASMVGFEGYISMYSARGTFITKMLDEGYHPVEVAEMSGNSPQTIYNNYFKQTKNESIQEHGNNMFKYKEVRKIV